MAGHWNASTTSGHRVYPRRARVGVTHTCGHMEQLSIPLRDLNCPWPQQYEHDKAHATTVVRLAESEDCLSCRMEAAARAIAAQPKPADPHEGLC